MGIKIKHKKKISTSVCGLDTVGSVEGALSGHSRPQARFRPGIPSWRCFRRRGTRPW